LKIDKELNIKKHDGVYLPSDDTFLLLEMIEVDGYEHVLEIGCGSGIISLHCSARGCDVLSVDKDKRAVKSAKINAEKNNLNISVKISHFFSNIDKTDWDTIIFNPPYLPNDDLIPNDDKWDGGKRGDEVVVRFLEESDDYLKDHGELYTCYSSLSPTDRIERIIERKYKIDKLEKRDFFFETLYGLKLNKRER